MTKYVCPRCLQPSIGKTLIQRPNGRYERYLHYEKKTGRKTYCYCPENARGIYWLENEPGIHFTWVSWAVNEPAIQKLYDEIIKSGGLLQEDSFLYKLSKSGETIRRYNLRLDLVREHLKEIERRRQFEREHAPSSAQVKAE